MNTRHQEGYLWPVLIMLDVLIVFIVYIRYLGGGDLPEGQPTHA